MRVVTKWLSYKFKIIYNMICSVILPKLTSYCPPSELAHLSFFLTHNVEVCLLFFIKFHSMVFFYWSHHLLKTSSPLTSKPGHIKILSTWLTAAPTRRGVTWVQRNVGSSRHTLFITRGVSSLQLLLLLPPQSQFIHSNSLASDWFRMIMWPEYWPLIGREWLITHQPSPRL